MQSVSQRLLVRQRARFFHISVDVPGHLCPAVNSPAGQLEIDSPSTGADSARETALLVANIESRLRRKRVPSVALAKKQSAKKRKLGGERNRGRETVGRRIAPLDRVRDLPTHHHERERMKRITCRPAVHVKINRILPSIRRASPRLASSASRFIAIALIKARAKTVDPLLNNHPTTATDGPSPPVPHDSGGFCY